MEGRPILCDLSTADRPMMDMLQDYDLLQQGN